MREDTCEALIARPYVGTADHTEGSASICGLGGGLCLADGQKERPFRERVRVENYSRGSCQGHVGKSKHPEQRNKLEMESDSWSSSITLWAP